MSFHNRQFTTFPHRSPLFCPLTDGKKWCKVVLMTDVLTETMSSEEACEMLKIHYNTLIRWGRKGKITRVEYPQRTYRYYREEVKKIMQEGL